MPFEQTGVVVLDDQGQQKAQNNLDRVLQSGSGSSRSLVDCLPEEVDKDLQAFTRLLQKESLFHWTHDGEDTNGCSLSFFAYRAPSGETMIVVERPSGVSGDEQQSFPLDKGIKTILDQSGHNIVMTDLSGDIIYSNLQVEETTGYSPEELLGENPRIFQSGYHSEEFYEELWDTILSGDIWTGKIRNQRKDGTEFVLDQTIAPLNDDQGEIAGFIAINRDVTEKWRERQTLKREADLDPILQVPGQEATIDLVRDQFREHPDTMGTFVLIDLNNYPDLEDALSRDVLSSLMKEVRNRVEACCWEHDILGKISDSELVLFTNRFERLEIAQEYVERILRETSQEFSDDGASYHLEVNIGYAHRNVSGVTPETLLDEARKALLAVRDHEDLRYQVYLPEHEQIRTEKRATLQLGERIRDGIAEAEFMPVFQPIVDLENECVSGFEALMRWDHPQKGLLSPYAFIEYARQEKLMDELEKQMMKQALTVIDELEGRQERVAVDIHINVEPTSFGDHDVLNRLQQNLEGRSVSSDQVHLEVVESEELRDQEAISELESLRDRGFHVSVDDFGTGYSSLNYLMDVPAETVKIDRSLIREIHEDQPTNPVLSAVVSMIQNLGKEIVAEGVETPFQHQVLRDFNVDYGQGYVYARPMPAKELEPFLEHFRLSDLV